MSFFSVIIPVYNEEEIIVQNINKLVDFLDGLDEPHGPHGPYEIIICSNGSTDATDIKGRKLEKNFPKKVRYFSIPERGVGLAFKEGVKNSAYDKLISIDVDLTSDLRFIPEALEMLDEYQIVIGSKKVGEQQRSFFRVLLSGGFIFLVRVLLKMRFLDYSIGTKAYKKDVIERWVEDIDHGSSYVIEIVYHAKESGCKIVEIPVFCKDTRKSKFNLKSEIFYRFKNLLRLFYRVRVKRIFDKGR